LRPSARFVILASAFAALLLWAVAAWAECAWVLWYEDGGWSTHSERRTSWGLVGAFTIESACRAESDAKVKDLAAGWAKDTAPGRTDTVEVRGNYVTRAWNWPGMNTSGGSSVRYICLPDTIDPRGPKGGGR
jgi:hypothetical protein